MIIEKELNLDKVAAVFALDNLEQFKKFFFAYFTLRKNNKDLKVYLLLNSSINDEFFIRNIKILNEDKNFNLIDLKKYFNFEKNFFDNAPTLLWTFSPFILKEDYLLILDNDIIINLNLLDKIKENIHRVKNDNDDWTLISKPRTWSKRSIGYKFLINEFAGDKDSNFIGGSTNIAIINKMNFVNKFKDINNLTFELQKYNFAWKSFLKTKIYSRKNPHFAPDEEFIFLHFNDKIVFNNYDKKFPIPPKISFQRFIDLIENKQGFVWHLHNTSHSKNKYWRYDSYLKNDQKFIYNFLKSRIVNYNKLNLEEKEFLFKEMSIFFKEYFEYYSNQIANVNIK